MWASPTPPWGWWGWLRPYWAAALAEVGFGWLFAASAAAYLVTFALLPLVGTRAAQAGS